MKKICLIIVCCMFLLTGCSSNSSNSLNVKEGDVVKIDFVGKLDGVAFAGGTASNYVLEIGSHTFIDGFEDQIVGMKLGEKKTIKVTFPTNYGSSSLAGKECTFDITLNHLYKEVK